jgi:isoleucyl-tRNA synthetase
VASAAAALDADRLRMLAGGTSVEVEVDGQACLIAPEDVDIIRRASGAAVVEENGGYGVALDPTVTVELKPEGLAREVISRVQRLRKEARLDVSDRITVSVKGDQEVSAAVSRHRDWIGDEVLALRVLVGEGEENGSSTTWTAMQEVDVEGRSIRLALRKEGV